MPTYGQYDVPKSDTMVNFGVGQPDNRKLPLNLIKNAMKKFIENEDNNEVLQYGDIPGYQRFREKLANWLSRECYQNVESKLDKACDINELNVSSEELFITNGVTNALHLIMTAYMYQDDTILVEDPSYFIMINIFKDFGLDVLPISMQNDGINLDELRKELNELYKKQEKVFLYTIPINHNPSGITMSHKKRLELAEICNEFPEFYILADEVYHFLSWEEFTPGEQVLPLADYHPNIVSINSFSKILAPSLRLGWIYQSNKFEYGNKCDIINTLKKSGIYDSTGGSGVLSSYLTEQLIDSGELSSYIKECKSFLGSRCKTICQNLLPLKEKDLIDFNVPIGGYFVWVKVNSILADDLLELSLKNKVKFHPGWKFTATDDNFKDYIRLSCSFYNEEDLAIGISRLTNTIENFNKIKVTVLGATGRLGKLIVDKINEKDELSYYGDIGRDFNISEIPVKNSVIIDVSSPEASNKLVSRLIEEEKNVPLIIGTTGDLDMDNLTKYSKNNAVGVISNFSDGIPAILEFSNILNKLPDNWKCKLIEKHHVNKKDKPSGTALSLAKSLNRACDTESYREGDIFGEHKLILSNNNEEIVIEHKAKNREIFAEGSIKYIDWILSLENGLYDKIDYNKYSPIRKRVYSASGNILMIVEFLDNKKWVDFVKLASKENSKLDGVIFLERYLNTNTSEMETKWTYYNKDGSCVPFCGNGVRCIGKYLAENYKELNGELYNGGNIRSKYKSLDDTVYFDSPKPHLIDSKTNIEKVSKLTNQFDFLKIKNIALVIVGVPHMIIQCECDIFEIDSSVIEFISYSIHESISPTFNVNFVNLIDKSNFKIRTYERGVNAETGSCGSGCLASYFYLNKLEYLYDSSVVHFLKDGSMELYVSGDPINKKFNLGGKVNEIKENM